MENTLIVLGMHRSGTSLVSNWLNKCGVHLGDHLLAADIFNKNGYFEDKDFLNLHEEILTHYKIVQTGLIPPFNFKLSNHYYKKLGNNVLQKNALYRQWGWKEPRTCLFIKYYKKLLPNAKYIIVYRDYSFVVESICRRQFTFLEHEYNELSETGKDKKHSYFENELEKIRLSTDIYLLTWIAYNKNLINHIMSAHEDNYIIVKHNELAENDEIVFNKLIQWGFEMRYSPFSQLLDPSLIKKNLTKITFNPRLERKAINIKNRITQLYDDQHKKL